MESVVLKVALAIAVFVGMEGVAWGMHRYVMHGALWCWHRGHHQVHKGVFELNDLFPIVFALPAIACFALSTRWPWWLPPAIGSTAYGMVYLLFHDGLVHERFPAPMNGRSRFWRKRLQAHRLHHAVPTRRGCVSYGFLWVRSVRELKAELKALQA